MSSFFSTFGWDKTDSRIKYIERNSPAYPLQFQEQKHMPSGFYLCGELPDPTLPSCAIVGARACSAYGRRQAISFATTLAQNGVQIISGMAQGIDSIAQAAAMDAGGKTFAILGSGIDICYPKSSFSIYQKIPKQGGLLSEFPMGSPPNAWHFPLRNRLISAFADVLLVVEARKKSGSLITCDYALDQGKSIYAIPGEIDMPLSEGCNHLIAQGAAIATRPEDLLFELGLLPKKKKETLVKKLSPPSFEDPLHQKVYHSFGNHAETCQSITEKTSLSFDTVSRILMQLCLSGILKEEAPGTYAKAYRSPICRK